MIKMGPETKKRAQELQSNDDEDDNIAPYKKKRTKKEKEQDNLWSFSKNEIDWLTAILEQNDQVARDYYLNTALAANYPVFFHEWKRTYSLIKDSPLFSWLEDLMKGYNNANMNLDPEIEGKQYERRMTMQVQKREKEMITSMDTPTVPGLDSSQKARLSSLEVDNIREFWNNDVKNRPAQEVHQLFRKMFKDMKN